MKGPIELPWTIMSLASDPKRRTYVDVSQDLPSEEQWIEDQQHPAELPGPEIEVPLLRMRRKGGAVTTSSREKIAKLNPNKGEKRAGDSIQPSSSTSSSRP
jgi:hypothetical protein